MAKHLQTGSKGEDLAVAFLKSNNCQILERNWRFGRAEIDIIARSDETLIFVEVKTRSTTTFGHPAEFVSHSQEQRIAEAASAYMEHINHDWAVRFDII
jgi:putative endonuclease